MTEPTDHRSDFERGQLALSVAAQQKLEFDRWRTAVTIVQCMREVGISCELFIDPRNTQ